MIEAFIVGQSDDRVADLNGLHVILLPQNFCLIPLNRELLGGRELSLIDAAEQTGTESCFVPETIIVLARKLSVTGKVAYIEAEMFGGEGLQASVVWESGHIIAGPIIKAKAINHALRMIGVEVETRLMNSPLWVWGAIDQQRDGSSTAKPNRRIKRTRSQVASHLWRSLSPLMLDVRRLSLA